MAIEPAEIHRVAPLQVKDLVYERLRESLIDLTFTPGEPLREAALVERFGVSKTPIREALVRLEREGLVEIAPYRGARARTYNQADVQEFYEVREILETECVRRASQGADSGIRDALARNVDSSASALESGDLRATAESLDEFGTLLLSQLQNRVITELLERLQAHLKRIGHVQQSEDYLGSVVEEHRAIVGAITAQDAGRAQDLLRRHLQHLLDDRIHAADPTA
ncbi:MAG TPA: GntR family transcriptional regulator [Kineosporiaceae bacterium]|nr:GntR family transcriptional regulator [Kineosporiaceae bacterium]